MSWPPLDGNAWDDIDLRAVATRVAVVAGLVLLVAMSVWLSVSMSRGAVDSAPSPVGVGPEEALTSTAEGPTPPQVGSPGASGGAPANGPMVGTGTPTEDSFDESARSGSGTSVGAGRADVAGVPARPEASSSPNRPGTTGATAAPVGAPGSTTAGTRPASSPSTTIAPGRLQPPATVRAPAPRPTTAAAAPAPPAPTTAAPTSARPAPAPPAPTTAAPTTSAPTSAPPAPTPPRTATATVNTPPPPVEPVPTTTEDDGTGKGNNKGKGGGKGPKDPPGRPGKDG